jgi:hypothetical protein
VVSRYRRTEFVHLFNQNEPGACLNKSIAASWQQICSWSIFGLAPQIHSHLSQLSEQIGSQMMVSSRAQASLLDRGGSA